MSIVKYVDKKTGRVTVYESTSHYDPVSKQSRPKRKYLGVEDPVTGELIPSSKIPGRRKKNGEPAAAKIPPKKEEPNKEESEYKLLADNLRRECDEKDKIIKELEKKNNILRADLERVKEIIDSMLKS